jgi:hypothetical protein
MLTRRSLRLGLGDWSHVEVLDGLVEGDRIVRSPDLPGIGEGVLAVGIDDRAARGR